MNIRIYPGRAEWKMLCKRPEFNRSNLTDIVKDIIQNVKRNGDKALYELEEKLDGVVLKNLKVSQAEIDCSAGRIPDNLKKSINIAKSNIEKFHRSQLIIEQPVETTRGVRCWRKNVPVENVGLYIPGGTAPLFSTVLMLAVPANIAGCKKITLCSPPDKKGNINPLILYAASISGIKDIFNIGGAQAIAAMAYGTESIPKTYKVFGPGNQFVNKAKEMIQSDGVSIDMPAGPSEVLVIADSTANPSFIASDLLAQAEHGPDSQVVLITNDSEILRKVKIETVNQLKLLPRKDIAAKALENSLLILMNSLSDCMDFSNNYAPEHLIISTSDSLSLADNVINAGSVFIGKYSCESAGDYASGTNHTLPTNGFARNFSGVSVDSFMRKITYQEITAEGLNNLGGIIEQMAEAESLTGHKNAVTIRLNSLKNV